MVTALISARNEILPTPFAVNEPKTAILHNVLALWVEHQAHHLMMEYELVLRYENKKYFKKES